MLLFIEIWLTISAWQKGYGPMALLPGACVFFLGMAIGGNFQGSEGEALAIGLALDIGCIVVLGIMNAVASESVEATVVEDDSPETTSSLDRLASYDEAGQTVRIDDSESEPRKAA